MRGERLQSTPEATCSRNRNRQEHLESYRSVICISVKGRAFRLLAMEVIRTIIRKGRRGWKGQDF